MKLLRFVVDPSLVAIDVGAHFGGYTHALLDIGCPVIAFEANPILADKLEKIYGRDAKIFCSALSSSPGRATLRIPRENGIATIETLNNLGGLDVDEVDVPKMTLDDAVSDTIGFMKIDVEGHELHVLQGAEGILRRDHPVILVEAENRHRVDAVGSVRKFLSSLGYCGFMLDGSRLSSISKFNPATDQFVPPEALNDLDTGSYKGRYINNFLFIVG